MLNSVVFVWVHLENQLKPEVQGSEMLTETVVDVLSTLARRYVGQWKVADRTTDILPSRILYSSRIDRPAISCQRRQRQIFRQHVHAC